MKQSRFFIHCSLKQKSHLKGEFNTKVTYEYPHERSTFITLILTWTFSQKQNC